MGAWTTTHQCVGCGTLIQPDRHSPYCPNCRPSHQLTRNREKVRAFRERVREAGAVSDVAPENRLPNEDELQWLDWLDQNLANPIRAVVERRAGGCGLDDPEVKEYALEALDDYDARRAELHEMAAQYPESKNVAEVWWGFFESIRRAYR